MLGFSSNFLLIFILANNVLFEKFSSGAPHKNVQKKSQLDLEIALSRFLDLYYDNYISIEPKKRSNLTSVYENNEDINADAKRGSQRKMDIYETMQGDQPVDDAINADNLLARVTNSTTNTSDINILQAARNRTKDNWIQMLKINILQQVGRANATVAIPGESRMAPLNLTQLFPISQNDSDAAEDFISKKIRTFYPSCTIPETAEQEFRNEDKMMNLYFNYTQDEQSSKIAMATLRLHRIPMENSNLTAVRPKNCTNVAKEEDKLIRVSLFWYLKPQRNKKRGKKRLCDSKVISENDRWVELNVATAVRAWAKDQNYGLAIEVEDQEEKSLKAGKYFKGPTCLVGMSTPKPIPTILMDDAAGTPEQLFRLLGRNTTAPVPGDILLYPTIDVCTLGFPLNSTEEAKTATATTGTDACNLRALHRQAQRLLEKDRLERLATLTSKLRPSASSSNDGSSSSSSLSSSSSHRHLRHQRNYIEEKLAESDTKILMTKEQVFEILRSLNLTNVNNNY